MVRLAAEPTSPSQPVRLGMVCTLAPPVPPKGLTAGEHRSAELLPCSRVADPWGRRAQPQCRGSFASAELGQDGLGRSPELGHRPPLRSVCAGQMWPWASCFPWAGPVVIGKLRFQFSFIIWKEKCFGKCLYTQICSKFVETNFARILVTRST